MAAAMESAGGEDAAATKPESPSQRRAAQQLKRLLEHVLKELGVEDDGEARARALGLHSRQHQHQVLKGPTNSFMPDNFEGVLTAISSLIQARAPSPHAHTIGGHTRFLVDCSCEPLKALDGLRKAMDRNAIPQRHLYDSAESARAWQREVTGDQRRAAMETGIQECLQQWLADGHLNFLRGHPKRLVALGSGTGRKEESVLSALEQAAPGDMQILLVDSSLALLAHAVQIIREAQPKADVTALCADFEHGQMRYVRDEWPAPQSADSETTRLFMMFGNIFGNLANEVLFVLRQVPALMRVGDYLWVEVATAATDPGSDPSAIRAKSYPIDGAEVVSGIDRLLVLPYLRSRRLELHREKLDFKVHLDLERSANVPGSYTLRYSLKIGQGAAQRSVDVLYARRYDEGLLAQCLRAKGLDKVASFAVPIENSPVIVGVTHLLLRYTGKPLAGSKARNQR